MSDTMYDKLVGYLLGALDDDELAYVEKMSQGNLHIRDQLERLRRALDPLEPDRAPVNVPEGLAVQTCQKIRQQRLGPQAGS